MSGGIEAARLFVKVGADTKDAEQGLSRVSDKLQAFGQHAALVGAGLTIGITAPLAAIGKQALGLAAEYEQGLNIFQAVSDATGDQMAAVAEKAKQLGADLTLPATSAGDAVTAMVELAKAGLSVNDTLAASKGVLQLSAAGHIGNAQAAKIAAQALNAFHLEGAEATRVADLLAAAANASAADIADLSLGIQQGGFAFSATHQKVEDLVGALSILSNVGLSGSDAGTALKNGMVRLVSPTNEAKKAMESLGISVYDAQGNMVPFRDIIDRFNTGLAGLTEQQRNAALETIFLSDGMKAFIPVLDGGVEGWDRMQASVNKGGAAADLAGSRMKGLAGSLEGLKSNLETTLLRIAEPLLQPLASMVVGVSQFVGTIGELPRPVLDAAIAFGAVLAAAGPLITLVGGLAMALGFFLSPLGLVTLGVAALAAAFAADFLGIRSTVIPIVENLAERIGAFAAQVKGYADEGFFLEGVAAAIDSAFGGDVARRFERFTQLIGDVFEALGNRDFAGAAHTVGTGVTEAIQDVTPQIVATLGEWGDAFGSWVAEALTLIPPALGEIASMVGSFIAEQVPAFVGQLAQWASAFVGWIADTVPPMLSGFLSMVGSLLDAIAKNAPRFTEAFISEMVPAFIGWILGTALPAFVGALADFFVKVVPRLVGFLVDLHLRVGSWVATEGAPKFGQLGLNMGEAIVRGVVKGIANLAGMLGSKLVEVGEQGLSSMKKALGIQSPSRRFLEEVGIPIVEGVAAGIEQAGASAGAAAGALAAQMVDSAATAVAQARPRARQIGESFWLAVSEVGTGDAFVTRFGEAGAQAVSNLQAYLTTDNPAIARDIEAKVGNTAQRAIAAARKAGITGADSLFTDILNTADQVIRTRSPELVQHFQDLMEQLFGLETAAKAETGARRLTDSIIQLGSRVTDMFRLTLSPAQGGGIANVFLDSVRGAIAGNEAAERAMTSYAERILGTLTRGMSPLAAISVTDQFTTAVNDALRAGDVSGLEAWLGQMQSALTRGTEQLAATSTRNLAAALNPMADYVKSLTGNSLTQNGKQYLNGREVIQEKPGFFAGGTPFTISLPQGGIPVPNVLPPSVTNPAAVFAARDQAAVFGYRPPALQPGVTVSTSNQPQQAAPQPSAQVHLSQEDINRLADAMASRPIYVDGQQLQAALERVQINRLHYRGL